MKKRSVPKFSDPPPPPPPPPKNVVARSSQDTIEEIFDMMLQHSPEDQADILREVTLKSLNHRMMAMRAAKEEDNRQSMILEKMIQTNNNMEKILVEMNEKQSKIRG